MKIRLFTIIILLLFPLTPVKAQIVNSGFETGDLTGWTRGGTGSIQVLMTGDLGTVVAPNGAFFALVSSGPGDIDDDGLLDQAILTSAPFTLSGNYLLSLSWDFLTAEFTGIDSDPTRLDAFEIALLPELGGIVLLESGNVAVSQPFSSIDGGNAVSAPDGSAFFERMEFQTRIYPIVAGTYSLRFTVSDVGDGSFDSALAIDAISFSAGSAAAPEPTPQWLLVIGGIGMASRYRKVHRNA